MATTKMIVEYQDLPVWVKNALKNLRYRKAVTVEIGTSHSFPGVISDNSFRTYVTRVGATAEKSEKTVVRTGAYGGQAPWNTKAQRMVNGPAKVQDFPAHVQILCHDTGWKTPTATLYVHPDYMAKSLPVLPDPAGIPWVVKVVLYATKTLKPSYAGIKQYRRYEAMRDTNITEAQYEQGVTLAIQAGYLRKNKAITAEGSNVVAQACREVYNLSGLRR